MPRPLSHLHLRTCTLFQHLKENDINVPVVYNNGLEELSSKQLLPYRHPLFLTDRANKALWTHLYDYKKCSAAPIFVSFSYGIHFQTNRLVYKVTLEGPLHLICLGSL